jgi:hypothetical protein
LEVFMIATLPVLMALSWVPIPAAQQNAPAPAAQKADQTAQTGGTITCRLTGSEIPSCCCPVKK